MFCNERFPCSASVLGINIDFHYSGSDFLSYMHVREELNVYVLFSEPV